MLKLTEPWQPLKWEIGSFSSFSQCEKQLCWCLTTCMKANQACCMPSNSPHDLSGAGKH